MKSIPLKKFKSSIVPGQQPIETDTAALIRIVLNNVQQGGESIDEIRKRIRIMEQLDKLKPADKFLKLEDQDHKTLLGALEKIRWAIIDKYILVFDDSIRKAE